MSRLVLELIREICPVPPVGEWEDRRVFKLANDYELSIINLDVLSGHDLIIEVLKTKNIQPGDDYSWELQCSTFCDKVKVRFDYRTEPGGRKFSQYTVPKTDESQDPDVWQWALKCVDLAQETFIEHFGELAYKQSTVNLAKLLYSFFSDNPHLLSEKLRKELIKTIPELKDAAYAWRLSVNRKYDAGPDLVMLLERHGGLRSSFLDMCLL